MLSLSCLTSEIKIVMMFFPSKITSSYQIQTNNSDQSRRNLIQLITGQCQILLFPRKLTERILRVYVQEISYTWKNLDLDQNTGQEQYSLTGRCSPAIDKEYTNLFESVIPELIITCLREMEEFLMFFVEKRCTSTF